MKVVFDKNFTKDAKRIKQPLLKQKIRQAIEQIERAESLQAINKLKKLKVHQTAYRVRVRDYRMGFFLLDQKTIELVRILHRKDISSNFP